MIEQTHQGERKKHKSRRRERRCSSRFIPNKLYANVSQYQGLYPAEVLNLGLGGALLQTTRRATRPRGRLELFDDRGSVTVKTKTVWQSATHTAVAFEDLSATSEEFLAQRIYTEVLRSHDPTIVIVDTNVTRGIELAQAIAKTHQLRVIPAKTPLDFIELLATNHPPITAVLAQDCQGFVSAQQVCDYVREENRAIKAFNLGSTPNIIRSLSSLHRSSPMKFGPEIT